MEDLEKIFCNDFKEEIIAKLKELKNEKETEIDEIINSVKEQRDELVRLMAEKSFYEEAIKNNFIEYNRVHRNILSNHNEDEFFNRKSKVIKQVEKINEEIDIIEALINKYSKEDEITI